MKGFQAWLPDGKIKPFILTTTITLFAFIISTIIAFRHDADILSFTERPRIAITKTPFDNGSYIFAKETPGGLETRVRFNISNNGGTYARNVRILPIYGTSIETIYAMPAAISIINQKQASTSPSGPISLAPQETQTLEISFENPVVDRRSVIDLLDKIKKDTFEMEFGMEICYEGEPRLNFQEGLGLEVLFKPSWVAWTYSVPKSCK